MATIWVLKVKFYLKLKDQGKVGETMIWAIHVSMSEGQYTWLIAFECVLPFEPKMELTKIKH